jgi:hypothetical protein
VTLLARALAIALTTAAALTAAGAPPARADITFTVMPGYAAVEDDDDATDLDLVRDGAVIASSDEGVISVEELKAGDVARAYVGTTPAGSATYDGTPLIGDACIGGATFTVTRSAAAVIEQAGGFGADSVADPLVGSWDAGALAHVTLSRALSDGDVAMVTVADDSAVPPVFSTRIEPAVPCGSAPATPAPKPGTEPTATKPALDASLETTGTALSRLKLARRTRLSLPFAFPEAGRIDLRVVVHGRVIAAGSRTASQPGKVTLKLSPAGHRLLRHTPKLKATLKATFTPSRAGATPQRASTKVTLTGSSSRA